ncbi:hypothetical protein [Pragia fontium]|uniref:Uncharacterized protein n=1 Tax=Pragia fontium DSM 5563 = ATCC 49100 TaxID=1122977 RepID=A0AAJ4WBZ2_9GAMM|nr:hypothetical protein [Pragia fontium]AKJ42562.1 hypothetical protein QQ39_11095 [Pragia fontium]SFD11933.1 hypothetical protein SAMN02745723_10863 [Pragia fontium DSM 5563 = ATCC 49100]SUB82891.1 Uncharacterised protein [Pragia fontium]VEJ55791.1 Uncharacterised protein [Pragia fontium]
MRSHKNTVQTEGDDFSLSYHCPYCQQVLLSRAPYKNEVWESSICCHHCEMIIYSIFYHNRVDAFRLTAN